MQNENEAVPGAVPAEAPAEEAAPVETPAEDTGKPVGPATIVDMDTAAEQFPDHQADA